MDVTDAIDDRQSIVLVLVVVLAVVVAVVEVVRAEMTEPTEFALGLRGERGGRGGDVEGGGESKGEEEEEEGEVPGPVTVWLLLSKCDGTPVGTVLPRSRRVVVSWGSRLPVVVLMVAAIIGGYGVFDGRWGGRNERNDSGVIGAACSLAMNMSEVGHRR